MIEKRESDRRAWMPTPLKDAVLDKIIKRRSITDDDLMDELKNVGVSYRELNGILLKLEVRGIVRVSRHMKNKRLIELCQ